MVNFNDIMETITMIQEENLDIRTITMGISLLDCADSDIDRACEKVYNKIYTKAKDLVATGEKIEKKYGIPIVNKRISVTPIAMLAAVSGGDPVKYAKTLDRAAKDVGVNFIGGYSALVQKGLQRRRPRADRIHPACARRDGLRLLLRQHRLHQGRHQHGCRRHDGKVVREAAELTKDRQCIGAAKLVVFCNAPEDNPFMQARFMVSVSRTWCSTSASPDRASCAPPWLSCRRTRRCTKSLSSSKKQPLRSPAWGSLSAAKPLVCSVSPSGIIDLSLAPTPAVGDSVAYILEEIGLEQCGTHGTTAALAMLNDAVKKGGVMASSSVGGLSGAFIPVTEDAGMIAAARSGCLEIEKLEAMTAVCSVGLDMIVIPGETPAETISAIIADEAAIGMVNSKTTAVRVIPAIGLAEGEELDFGGLLGNGPVMKLHTQSSAKMIHRGGRIPAPMQSLKN